MEIKKYRNNKHNCFYEIQILYSNINPKVYNIML